jgi:hypothetical protein
MELPEDDGRQNSRPDQDKHTDKQAFVASQQVVPNTADNAETGALGKRPEDQTETQRIEPVGMGRTGTFAAYVDKRRGIKVKGQ